MQFIITCLPGLAPLLADELTELGMSVTDRGNAHVAIEGRQQDGLRVCLWSRLAERVLVVVTSGNIKATDLAQTQTRLGRDGAIGYVLVGASESTAKLPDREGPVEHFWVPSPSPR